MAPKHLPVLACTLMALAVAFAPLATARSSPFVAPAPAPGKPRPPPPPPAHTCSNPQPNKYDAKSDDKVQDWSKNCAAAVNEGCERCGLWTNVAKPASKSSNYVYSGTNSQRAKILPTVPLQGLESIVRDKQDAATEFLWEKALEDAAAGKIPNVQRTGHPIAFINSLNARTQHQLHIHVGATSQNKFYECAKAYLRSPPTVGLWPTISSKECDALSSKPGTKVGVLVTTANAGGINKAIRAGFPKAVAKVNDITQDGALLRTGVVVQKTATGQYLVFLITGTHVNDATIFD